VVPRKTKRMALVTAVSASLVMAGAAAFATNDSQACPRGQWTASGGGLHNHDEGHPGNYDQGWWHKCDQHDNNGGGNPGGHPGGNPGGNPGGSSSSDNGDDHGIGVNVTVHVDLPDIDLPDGGFMAHSAYNHVMAAKIQAVTLAGDDVANLMQIVQAAGEDATSVADGTIAQAGVSVSGTSGSGTVNVSSGAVGGATTLGSSLTSSTLNLLNTNMEGGQAIVFGTMVSML